ncbi:putative zinc-binding protein [Candidatus Poribacteria bacterium]
MEAKTRRQFLKGVGGVALGVAGVVGMSGLSRSAENEGAAVADKDGIIPCCEGDERLVFPCSGASDVGGLSDEVSRKMSKEEVGRMYCLAAIGAGVESFVETTKAATQVMAIDGCPVGCATKCLEKAGIKPITIGLKELGFVRGESPATEELVNDAFSKIKGMME